MLRHFPQPLHAGGLETDVGVQAEGDGPVDDGLLLLFQQADELPLGNDVAADAPVGVVEVVDDGGLLFWRRNRLSHVAYDMPICARHFGAKRGCVDCVYNRL